MRRTEMRERFLDDTREHVMDIIKDDGLYRHVRFQKPGSSFYYYDLVTWPGHLVICGDAGDYHFSRIRDMFEFFESDGDRINPDYWSGKLQGRDSARTGARSYDESVFRARVLEWFDDEARDLLGLPWGTKADDRYLARAWLDGGYDDGCVFFEGEEFSERSLEDAISLRLELDDQVFGPWQDIHYEEGARLALREFEFKDYRFVDTWEWDFTEFDTQFIWCCWAIVHGIAQYRKAATSVATSTIKQEHTA